MALITLLSPKKQTYPHFFVPPKFHT